VTNDTRLLHKALANRDLSPLFSRGVTDLWFKDDADRRLFSFLRRHFSEYGECPSIQAVQDNFPNFELEPVEDSVEYLLDYLISSRRKKATLGIIERSMQIIEKEDDHEAVLLEMQSGVAKLDEEGFSFSTDLDLTADPDVRFQEYLNRKNHPDGILGFPTGLPTIDSTISGVQNGQFIVIAALPKTGKSTLLMQMGINMHNAGNTIMFQTFEMSSTEQASRYDAMRSRLSHQRLITGTLTPEEEARYRTNLNNLKRYKGFHLVDSNAGMTVTGVANKIQTLQPEIVIIDGIYLMIDENGEKPGSPQAITNITRSLKRLAQKTNKPIIVSTQFLESKTRGGKADMYSIGYSSSFGQDADVVLGLEKEDDSVDELRTLKIMASRNSGPANVTLTWDWNTGIFKEMDETDL